MKFMQRKQEAQRRLELQSLAHPSTASLNQAMAGSSSSSAQLAPSESVTILEARPAINHMLGRRQFGVVARAPVAPVAPAYSHPLSAGPTKDDDAGDGANRRRRMQHADDIWAGEGEEQETRHKFDRRRSGGGGSGIEESHRGRRFCPDEAVERQPPMPQGLERDMKRRRREAAVSRRQQEYDDDDNDGGTAGVMERF